MANSTKNAKSAKKEDKTQAFFTFEYEILHHALSVQEIEYSNCETQQNMTVLFAFIG